MPYYLRQSTASQEVPLGYFVDSTDGNTEKTALTIANTDIKIHKTGATTLANKNSGGGTHISNGIYYAVLDATDTDTIGPMVLFVHVSGALAVRLECCVLDEAVYDVLFGTTALATATNITAAAGCAVASIGNNVITAASIAADAITAAKIATDAIDSDAIAASAVTEIQAGLSTLDAAGVRAAVGLAAANLDTQLTAIDDYIDTEVAAIKAKTDNLPSDPADASDIAAAFTTVNTKLDAIDDYVDTEVAAIKAQTDKLTFDGSNRLSSNLKALNDDATAAANIAKTTRAVGRGTVDAGATTTSIPTSGFAPAGVDADQFKGRIITFDADTTTTALRGQSTDITANDAAAAPTFTVTALTRAPAAGDTFSVT